MRQAACYAIFELTLSLALSVIVWNCILPGEKLEAPEIFQVYMRILTETLAGGGKQMHSHLTTANYQTFAAIREAMGIAQQPLIIGVIHDYSVSTSAYKVRINKFHAKAVYAFIKHHNKCTFIGTASQPLLETQLWDLCQGTSTIAVYSN